MLSVCGRFYYKLFNIFISLERPVKLVFIIVNSAAELYIFYRQYGCNITNKIIEADAAHIIVIYITHTIYYQVISAGIEVGVNAGFKEG